MQHLPAQNFIEPQFGELSPEEVAMEFCPFDSSADAVVLFDIGKSKFISGYEDFDIWFTRHKRIKIFSEQGFNHAEVSIPFYVDDNHEEEKIESIEAYTYLFENGKIQKHKLDPEAVYTEVINQWWKTKKFVFPNLKEGAIIEYKYIHKTPFLFNLSDWEFQSDIPTLHSHYEVSMIPFYEYVYLSQGMDALKYHSSVIGEEQLSFRGSDYRELVHTFVMKNVEGFKDESYITSKNDYIKKLDFQLAKIYNLDGTSREVIPTWSKLNRNLLASENFGRYINGCKRFAKKSLDKIDLTNKTELEKTEILVNYVKQSFYWNGYYGKYTSQKANEFYKKKAGNAAEINLFLLALMREADINADPMITSTRNHGKLSLLYPISRKFNYVLVYVNGSDFSFSTDATSPLIDFLMVPPHCINDYGLIVNKAKEVQWAQIRYNQSSVNYMGFDIQVNSEQGICEVSANIKTDFFEAYRNRSDFKNDTTEIIKTYEENFDNVFNIETKNYDNPKLPYEIRFDARKELSWINNYLIIEPFFGFPPTENLLKQDKRDYPVDILYPKHYQYVINLDMPEDYIVEKLPDFLIKDDDLVSIKFSAVMDNQNNRLRIIGEYIFKKAVYGPENYALLKSHIDSIIEKFNIELIIKEKLAKENA